MDKKCTKCGKMKSADAFPPRENRCKDCQREYKRARDSSPAALAYKRKRDSSPKALEYKRKRDSSPAVREYKRSVDGGEKRKEYRAKRLRDNPELRVATDNARRSRLKKAEGRFTAKEWSNLKRKYEYTCLCCGRREPEIKLHADHVQALADGGSNDIGNIQPLCAACNIRKGGRTKDYR